jgi:polysaccharide export outer membrane protein
LGPEDEVIITVLGHPEYSGDFIVKSDGKISLPFVGEIQASGLTIDQLTAESIRALQTNKDVGLKNPRVAVSVKVARSQRIYVLGDVRSAGVFDLKPGWRITEALAAAGGITDTTQGASQATGYVQFQLSDFVVSLLRGGSVRDVQMADVVGGATDKDLQLLPGDVLTVRRYRFLTVYVAGSVQRPGIYQVSARGGDVLKAISLAGGFLPTASTGHVQVTRSTGEHLEVDLSGTIEKGMPPHTPLVQSGDLVVVPELQSKFAVLGLVKLAGIFPLPDGKDIRISDAIAMAQGYESRAKLSRVAFVQFNDGHPTHKIIDFRRWLRNGDLTMNPLLKPGDVVMVPETDTPNWGEVFSALTDVGLFLIGNQGVVH